MAAQPSPMRIPVFTFGDRLRRAREDAGLEQSQVAEALAERGWKLSQGAISKWERGDRQPRKLFDLAVVLGEILSVPASWLLGGDARQAQKSRQRSHLALLHGEGLKPGGNRPIVTVQ